MNNFKHLNDESKSRLQESERVIYSLNEKMQLAQNEINELIS